MWFCNTRLKSGAGKKTEVNESRRLDVYKQDKNEKKIDMANTYHQIYLQMVFAVKYRTAVLDKAWRNKVFGVIGNLINETNCKTIIVNGVEDHVHCFAGLRPVVSVSELMKTVKAKSSKYINDHNLTTKRFEWQEGYGVFSYRQRDVDQIYNYIKNQETHHQKQSFKDEYLELLKEFEVGFDEQYLFQQLI
jgi:putative transposase